MERLGVLVDGVDDTREMDWKEYAVAMLLFSVVSMLALPYLMPARAGACGMPWNPHTWPTVPSGVGSQHGCFVHHEYELAELRRRIDDELFHPDGRPGHTTFASAGVGLALAIAVIRGIARKESKTLGNFWVDVTRALLVGSAPYLLW